MLVLGRFPARPAQGETVTHFTKPPSQPQALTITIHADRFQPFQSRVGPDTVVRLRFEYDAALIDRLKAILAVYVVGIEHRTVGGWLPKHNCWFVEPAVWDVVRMELLYLGHRVLERKP